jgi:putative two-component system response regulator
LLTEALATHVDNPPSGQERPTNAESAGDSEKPATPSALPARPKIMMVDDEKLNIYVVAEYLKTGGYRDLIFTDDPLQALLLASRERPDAILLDIQMPRVSGLDILKQIREDEALSRTPVVVLTSSADNEVKLRALELGATDFLHKPVHSGELLARLRNILMAKAYQDHLLHYSTELEAAVRQRTAELEASRQDVVHCLARAAEFRDDDTGRHVIRVGRYARIIGQQLGMSERSLDVLEQAAKLHDIGKIGIPDAILLKPGTLTPEQFAAMQKHSNFGKKIIERMADNGSDQLRQHAELGSRILDAGDSPLLMLAMKIALTHHERWDGTGYPLGLAGADIPLEGRITAVADVFDALSTQRPYKPAFPLDQCFSIMQEARGSHFDPAILDAFMASRDAIVAVQIAYADLG